MSWSVTVNNIPEFEGFDEHLIEEMMTQHIKYPEDMQLALDVARKAGFRSAALLGFRTPNPYGGDEVAEITVRGLTEAVNFQNMMKQIIFTGPDETSEVQ